MRTLVTCCRACLKHSMLCHVTQSIFRCHGSSYNNSIINQISLINVYVPVAPTQPNNIPVKNGMVQATAICSGHPQALPNASLIPTQVVLKEVAASPQSVVDLSSQQYQKIPAAHQHIHLPRIEPETRFAGAQIQHQPQSFGVAAGETVNNTNRLDDDPAPVQIYKSQPTPPMLTSQYQTMTKATALLLSDALAKLHADNAEQQITAPEP
ncbi:uncharacterized protein LOC120177074 isoform X1 [Hibiscus syriacus]|uniref:uncharacterized protein LOC120177074 isoform X1 n=1 Tax=Hibiscus syriacus TaxID=106335 RepID=UPI00192056FA|nr:uncharacterized protein LOC120177074 isoform X1 [Hibiscus syriacus]